MQVFSCLKGLIDLDDEWGYKEIKKREKGDKSKLQVPQRDVNVILLILRE